MIYLALTIVLYEVAKKTTEWDGFICVSGCF